MDMIVHFECMTPLRLPGKKEPKSPQLISLPVRLCLMINYFSLMVCVRRKIFRDCSSLRPGALSCQGQKRQTSRLASSCLKAGRILLTPVNRVTIILFRKGKSYLNCPICHFDNPSESKICLACGAQLSLDTSTPDTETKTQQTASEKMQIQETVSDKYKILEELGRGGMGIVYKAEQIKPVRRQVALKIIKLGMDTAEVVSRFETERQALAVMDHPFIAKVLDAGVTNVGRSYFVMELVRGVPITEYCDKNMLTTEERLRLFVSVCQAVQHAHQKGVIHRDLKPKNILVSLQHDQPVPKIIDFGIAKATGYRLTERTLFTEQGQLIGTPEYMSPEQAEMSGLDVDTRTDIYSLGVMLYELLAGVLPFDPKSLREAGFSEIQRIIRDTDPPKASTRLSSLGDTLSRIAKHRKTDPTSLSRQLKGDLDWIIMKAMEKDRARRYETPNALAMDIQHYLDSEPVMARPPSAGYRLRKFVRRHKMGAAAAVAITCALLIGIMGLIVGFREAVKARNEAVQQAAKVEAINQFLSSMLSSPDPGKEGRDVRVIDILDHARERIDESFKDKQDIEASVRYTLGRTYEAVGVYEKSIAELEQSLDIQQHILGPDHPDTLKTLNSLSAVFIRIGKYADAEKVLLDAIERQKRVLGAEHPDTIISMHNLGVVYYYQGKHSESEIVARETLEIRKRVLDKDHPDIIGSLENLAIALSGQKEHAEAEQMYEEARKTAIRIRGPDHPQTLRIMHNLACELKHLKEFERSESMFLDVLQRQKKVFGSEHPDTIITMANFADLLFNGGRFQEAEALAREALEKEKKVFGEDHPLTKFTSQVLEAALNAARKGFNPLTPASGRTLGQARQGSLRTLVLEGRPYDRGFKHGRTLKDDIHRLVKLWKASLVKTADSDADVFIQKFLGRTNFQTAIQKWTPDLWEEIKGIAAGSGIDFDTIFAFQLVDELWVLGRAIQTEHCTTIGTNRSGPNPAIAAQNLDIPTFYHGFQTLLHIREPDKDLQTMVFTFPGFIATNGINSHSVAVVVNAVQQLENSRDGLPVAFVIRGILQRSSYEEAVRFLKSVKHGAPQNYMIGGKDKVGSFECATTHVSPFLPFDGSNFTYHTNHPLRNLHYRSEFLRYLESKQIPPAEYKHPCVRFEALQGLLKDNSVRIDVNLLKDIFRRRDIRINNSGTFGCTIMVLGDDPELHVSSGRPDEEPFQVFRFHTQ